MVRRLAIIPARGGSKGIPDKNLQEVAGQSLVRRAVSCAVEAGIFDRILVSTDSSRIADHVREAGFDVPFLRSAQTSGDTATTSEVIVEVLDALADFETPFHSVTVLEPTSPMRNAADVVTTALAVESTLYDAALTLSPVALNFHASKQVSLMSNGVTVNSCNREPVKASPPRQLLEATYIRNGVAYSVQTQAFLATRSLMGNCAKGIVIERPLVNIDNFDDLDHARRYLE